MPTTAPPPGVDELRERLRALGYLDAGVNRFVLAPATGARSALAIAARSSLRVGLLAGLLLGPAGAIGIRLRLPGLVTGPRDALVVVVYLAVLFGLTVAAAAFVASGITHLLAARVPQTSTFARRGSRLSIASGVAVGGLCLLYLTLWWRTASGGFGWNAPAWTAFALLVAVAISLLLGRAVTVTALALIARTVGTTSLAPRTRRSFWTAAGPLGLAAFAGAAVLLLSTTPRSGTSAPSDFAVVPTGLRVQLVAIDGFDVALADRLEAAGRLPTLGRLARGARASLAPSDTSDPARLWTTIATGQPPEVHGVVGLETRRVAGVQGTVPASRSPVLAGLAAATDLVRLTRPAIASDDQRREKTFWEVASEKGLRTAVVNWWATWPAPSTSGIVVSDRALLRLERGGVLDAELAPADLYPQLKAAYPALADAARSLAATAFRPVGDPAVQTVLRRSAEIDALLIELARHPLLGSLDLSAVYLPGLDIAQHALLSGPGTSPVSPSAIAARVIGLEAYYEFLDRLLGGLLLQEPPADDGRLLAVVTQPGRVAGGGDGLLILAGHGVRPGGRIAVRAVDVAPTLLYALGIPASRELAGRPITAVFDDAFVARYPVREIARYGSRRLRPPERRGQPLDEEMIERMRSLGYLR